MPYSPKAVANYFISNIPGITPMKLQKLVYYAHAASLAFRNEPLITERVQAWKYGPVVKSLYDEFRRFANNSINALALDFQIDPSTMDGPPSFKYIPPEIHKSDTVSLAILDAIKNKFGNLSAEELSSLTHQQGEAWWKTFVKSDGHLQPFQEIDDQDIKESFQQLYLGNANVQS